MRTDSFRQSNLFFRLSHLISTWPSLLQTYTHSLTHTPSLSFSLGASHLTYSTGRYSTVAVASLSHLIVWCTTRFVRSSGHTIGQWSSLPSMLFIVGCGCGCVGNTKTKRHVYPLASLDAIGQLYCSISNINQRITSPSRARVHAFGYILATNSGANGLDQYGRCEIVHVVIRKNIFRIPRRLKKKNRGKMSTNDIISSPTHSSSLSYTMYYVHPCRIVCTVLCCIPVNKHGNNQTILCRRYFLIQLLYYVVSALPLI